MKPLLIRSCGGDRFIGGFSMLYNMVANNDTYRMSSREIAFESGKQHKHILESIRLMEISWLKVGEPKFRLTAI